MEEITSWISQRRKLSDLKVTIIPLSKIKDWTLTETRLFQNESYYFSVIGVSIGSEKRRELNWEQPIILQKEVGILGFVVQNEKILLQAKTEPGNVNGTQIAPSVQATVSNYLRVHKGDETKFLNLFQERHEDVEYLSDFIQLEQGTRFMNKSNQNAIVKLQSSYVLKDLDDRFRWYDIKDVLALMEENFLINTDSRSVLVSCKWEDLTGNKIAFFVNQKDQTLKKILNASYYWKDSHQEIFEILDKINQRKLNFRVKNLKDLKNWVYDEEVIFDEHKTEFEVRGFQVSVQDREISYWEQPLVHNLSLGIVVLFCQMRDGILKFLLNAQLIVGLEKSYVWGPSIQSTQNEDYCYEGQETIAECMQSDEGGRFYQSKCWYKIVKIPENQKIEESEFSYWASLAEIQEIVIQDKKTTNELRSVLSLLLKFL